MDLTYLNPWKNFEKTTGELLLSDDQRIVEKFSENERFKSQFDFTLPPEPIIGNFDKAEIIFLQLNPGLVPIPGTQNFIEHHMFSLYEGLRQDIYRSMKQEEMEYPFYYLNPSYALSPGFQYWTKKLKYIIEDDKGNERIPLNTLASKICCIEYFPYHSKNFSFNKKKYRSSPHAEFAYELIREAKRRGKFIVVMRSAWFEIMREFAGEPLEGYSNLLELKSSQNMVLTEKNSKDESKFDKMLRILER